MPDKQSSIVQQRLVKNLNVFKSPSANVRTTSSSDGNIEMWVNQYSQLNAKKIPLADDGVYDFGDERVPNEKFYGCFQVHDYLQKQTVLAVNNLFADGKHDIGIGNYQGSLNSDWTFAKNSAQLKNDKTQVTLTWWFQNAGFDQTLKK